MKKLISILSIIMFTSCTEDLQVLTPGEVVGRELQTQTEKLGISTATVFVWRNVEWETASEGDFSISGQFLVMGNSVYFDLTNLYEFSLDPDRDRVSIYLN